MVIILIVAIMIAIPLALIETAAWIIFIAPLALIIGIVWTVAVLIETPFMYIRKKLKYSKK